MVQVEGGANVQIGWCPVVGPSGGDFGDLEYICGKRNESQHGLR